MFWATSDARCGEGRCGQSHRQPGITKCRSLAKYLPRNQDSPWARSPPSRIEARLEGTLEVLERNGAESGARYRRCGCQDHMDLEMVGGTDQPRGREAVERGAEPIELSELDVATIQRSRATCRRASVAPAAEMLPRARASRQPRVDAEESRPCRVAAYCSSPAGCSPRMGVEGSGERSGISPGWRRYAGSRTAPAPTT